MRILSKEIHKDPFKEFYLIDHLEDGMFCMYRKDENIYGLLNITIERPCGDGYHMFNEPRNVPFYIPYMRPDKPMSVAGLKWRITLLDKAEKLGYLGLTFRLHILDARDSLLLNILDTEYPGVVDTTGGYEMISLHIKDESLEEIINSFGCPVYYVHDIFDDIPEMPVLIAGKEKSCRYVLKKDLDLTRDGNYIK